MTGQRFQRPHSNDLWQIDGTEHRLVNGRQFWVVDILDDRSRFLLAALVGLTLTGALAWEAMRIAVAAYGLPRQLLSDNGTTFTGKLHGFVVYFERQVRAAGIDFINGRVRHPQTQGKIERQHRHRTSGSPTTGPTASSKRSTSSTPTAPTTTPSAPTRPWPSSSQPRCTYPAPRSNCPRSTWNPPTPTRPVPCAATSTPKGASATATTFYRRTTLGRPARRPDPPARPPTRLLRQRRDRHPHRRRHATPTKVNHRMQSSKVRSSTQEVSGISPEPCVRDVPGSDTASTRGPGVHGDLREDHRELLARRVAACRYTVIMVGVDWW